MILNSAESLGNSRCTLSPVLANGLYNPVNLIGFDNDNQTELSSSEEGSKGGTYVLVNKDNDDGAFDDDGLPCLDHEKGFSGERCATGGDARLGDFKMSQSESELRKIAIDLAGDIPSDMNIEFKFTSDSSSDGAKAKDALRVWLSEFRAFGVDSSSPSKWHLLGKGRNGGEDEKRSILNSTIENGDSNTAQFNPGTASGSRKRYEMYLEATAPGSKRPDADGAMELTATAWYPGNSDNDCNREPYSGNYNSETTRCEIGSDTLVVNPVEKSLLKPIVGTSGVEPTPGDSTWTDPPLCTEGLPEDTWCELLPDMLYPAEGGVLGKWAQEEMDDSCKPCDDRYTESAVHCEEGVTCILPTTLTLDQHLRMFPKSTYRLKIQGIPMTADGMEPEDEDLKQVLMDGQYAEERLTLSESAISSDTNQIGVTELDSTEFGFRSDVLLVSYKGFKLDSNARDLLYSRMTWQGRVQHSGKQDTETTQKNDRKLKDEQKLPELEVKKIWFGSDLTDDSGKNLLRHSTEEKFSDNGEVVEEPEYDTTQNIYSGGFYNRAIAQKRNTNLEIQVKFCANLNGLESGDNVTIKGEAVDSSLTFLNFPEQTVTYQELSQCVELNFQSSNPLPDKLVGYDGGGVSWTASNGTATLGGAETEHTIFVLWDDPMEKFEMKSSGGGEFTITDYRMRGVLNDLNFINVVDEFGDSLYSYSRAINEYTNIKIAFSPGGLGFNCNTDEIAEMYGHLDGGDGCDCAIQGALMEIVCRSYGIDGRYVHVFPTMQSDLSNCSAGECAVHRLMPNDCRFECHNIDVTCASEGLQCACNHEEPITEAYGQCISGDPSFSIDEFDNTSGILRRLMLVREDASEQETMDRYLQNWGEGTCVVDGVAFAPTDRIDSTGRTGNTDSYPSPGLGIIGELFENRYAQAWITYDFPGYGSALSSEQIENCLAEIGSNGDPRPTYFNAINGQDLVLFEGMCEADVMPWPVDIWSGGQHPCGNPIDAPYPSP